MIKQLLMIWLRANFAYGGAWAAEAKQPPPWLTMMLSVRGTPPMLGSWLSCIYSDALSDALNDCLLA